MRKQIEDVYYIIISYCRGLVTIFKNIFCDNNNDKKNVRHITRALINDFL